ncbi:MAG: O-antigen ligase family protein [Acidobacteriota bacterium]
MTLIVLIALSAAPVLKIGDVQAVEILQTLWLALAAPAFLYRGMRVPYSWRGYALFLGLCLALSAVALRLPFYPPLETGFLKQPGLLSLARIFELSLAICFMLIVARLLARRRALLRLALDAYCAIGVLSAWVSLAAWALARGAGIETFPVYGDGARLRGFFNEGGPYGVYLVSVAVTVLLRARLMGRARNAALVSLGAALFLSGSKAGVLAAACLCGIGAAVTGSRARRIAVLGSCAAVLAIFLALFQGRMYGYMYSYLNFDEVLVYRPGDPSLIMGRIAAALIVPRMIAAHPLVGIGAGNYSLMRNDPVYLQGLPPVDDWDLAGMGLFGSAAEFGLPLTVFLLALLLRPLIAARKRRAPAIVAVAAGFQPLAFLLGVNLNFFYPWLVGALVIAAESEC